MRRLATLAIVLCSGSALAQGNYRSAPMGGRSALMGNTGVAMGTDGAAPFLNPATVVAVESSLTVALSFISLEVLRVSDWYVPGAVDSTVYGSVPRSSDANVTRVSGNAVPSTACIFTALPRLAESKEPRQWQQKVAVCFGATERYSFDWVGQGYQAASGSRSTFQTSSVRFGWQRFVVSPTYALHVTDTLALGASIQSVFTDYNYTMSVGSTTAGPSLLMNSSSLHAGGSGTDFGLGLVFGATYRLPDLVIGASIQTPDVSVYGHGNASSFVQYASPTEATTTAYIGEGGFHARAPTRFNVGIGYPWQRGSVELDAHLALGDSEAVVLKTRGAQLTTPDGVARPASLTLTTPFHPTVNVGLGAEYFLVPTLSVLGGFGTDLSAVAPPSSESAALTQMHRVFSSFGFGMHGSGGTVLVGAQLYYGWGQSLSPNIYQTPPTLGPAGIDAYGLMLVLAGATSLKSIQSAIVDVKEAGDPQLKK